MLAIWTITDRDEPGSYKPKNSNNTFKFSLLLIGKKSVNPCIIP